jgi:hypothetical protein
MREKCLNGPIGWSVQSSLILGHLMTYAAYRRLSLSAANVNFGEWFTTALIVTVFSSVGNVVSFFSCCAFLDFLKKYFLFHHSLTQKIALV